MSTKATGCNPARLSETLFQEWREIKSTTNDILRQINKSLKENNLNTQKLISERNALETAKEKTEFLFGHMRRQLKHYKEKASCCGCTPARFKAFFLLTLETLTGIATATTATIEVFSTEPSGAMKVATVASAVTTLVLSKLKDCFFIAWGKEEREKKTIYKIERESFFLTNINTAIQQLDRIILSRDDDGTRSTEERTLDVHNRHSTSSLEPLATQKQSKEPKDNVKDTKDTSDYSDKSISTEKDSSDSPKSSDKSEEKDSAKKSLDKSKKSSVSNGNCKNSPDKKDEPKATDRKADQTNSENNILVDPSPNEDLKFFGTIKGAPSHSSSSDVDDDKDNTCKVNVNIHFVKNESPPNTDTKKNTSARSYAPALDERPSNLERAKKAVGLLLQQTGATKDDSTTTEDVVIEHLDRTPPSIQSHTSSNLIVIEKLDE